MPDPINLNSLAVQTDFSSISQDDVATLLNQNRTGSLTLDSQGHLTVITAPPRRDNCVVRFFKGIFNAGYREQQKQLDRLPVLDQNAEFSRQILNKLVNITRAENPVQPEVLTQHLSAALELTGKMQERGPLTLESLHAATQVTAMKSEVSSSVQAGFHASQGRAVPILLEGHPMELATFLKTHGAGESNTTDTLLHNTCQQAIIQAMKGVSMQTCKLLTRAEQNEMVGLLARPVSSLQPADQTRLGVLMTRISTNLATHLSNFANKALQEGAHPTAVANQVKQCMDALANSQDVNVALEELNPKALAQQHPADSLPVSNPRNEPDYNTLLQAMGNDPIKAARLEMLITSLNLSPEEQTLALSLREGLSSMFENGVFLYAQEDARAVNAMDEVVQLVQDAQAKGIADDRLPQLYEAALFARMLDGTFDIQPPHMAPLFIESCQQLMKETDSEFLAGANNSEHPVNILLTSAKVMRDKIQPLLDTGTKGEPITPKAVNLYSSLISKVNIHAHLNMAVNTYLETVRSEDFGPEKADIQNAMRMDLNVDIPANAKELPSEEVLEGYFQKVLTKRNTPLGDMIHSMMDSMNSDPVSLDAFNEILYTIDQKSTTLVHSREMIDASTEREKILQREFDAVPSDSRLKFYDTLMKDNSVGQYIALTNALFLASDDVQKDSPNTLMNLTAITACMNQNQTLQSVMVALEASLGLDQKNEQGVLPCIQHITDIDNMKISEHVYSVPINFLKKFNLEGEAHLRRE